MKKISLEEVKRNLKRVLKNKISIDEKTVITYLMMGMLGISQISMGGFVLTQNANTQADGAEAIAAGTGASAKDNEAIAVGKDASAIGNYSIVVGTGASAKDGEAIAIGKNANAEKGNAIVMGNSATALLYDSIAIGKQAKVNNKNNADQANPSDISGGSGIAIGMQSTTEGDSAVAIGKSSFARNSQSVALGANSKATGSQSIALGGDSQALGHGSIALGADDADGTAYQDLRYNDSTGKVEHRGNGNQYQRSTASGVASIAIGVKTQSTGQGSVAMGVLSSATGEETVALGAKAAAKGVKATALGTGSTASGEHSLAIAENSIASGTNALSIGYGAQATTDDTFAIGTSSQATGKDSLAIGKNAQSINVNTIAIGTNSLASTKQAFAVGVGSRSINSNTIAIGTNSLARGMSSLAFGNEARANGQDSHVIGTLSRSGKDAKYAFAAGIVARVNGERSIAIGYNVSTGRGLVKDIKVGENGYNENDLDENIATAHIPTLPTDNTLAEDVRNENLRINGEETGERSIAIGDSVAVTGRRSGYIGMGNSVSRSAISGTHSYAIGNTNEIKSNYTFALGNSISIAKGIDEAVALGNKAAVSVAGGVALGANSVANTAAGAKGYDMLKEGESTETSATWVSKVGAVSVGKANNTRQITNLAAGTQDTDAVNVAQLKKAKVEVVQGAGVTVTRDDAVTTHKKYTIKINDDIMTKINSIPANIGDLSNKVDTANTKLGDTALPDTKIEGSNNQNAPTTVTGAISDLATAVNKGISIQGNDATAINKKLGETFDIIGSHTTDNVSSKNIKTKVKNDNGQKLEILMATKPDFEEITVGTGTDPNTKINIGKNGKISGVAEGAVNSTSNEVVTGKQLYNVAKNLGVINADGSVNQIANLTPLKNKDGSDKTPKATSTMGAINDITSKINEGFKYGADKDEANSANKTHYLGSKLSVKSATAELEKTGVAGTKFVGKNLVTEYKYEAGDAVISIGLSEKPEFKEVSLKDDATYPGKTTTLNPEGTTIKEEANGVTKETKTTATGTNVVEKDAQGTATKTATYGSDGTTLTGKDAQGNPITASYKTDGSTLTAGDKQTKTTADGVTAKDGDTTSTLTGDGLTVKGNNADTPSTTYGKDGMSIKGADGKTTEIGRNDKGDLTITKKDADGSNAKTDTLATGGDLKALEDKLGLNDTKPATAATGPAGKDGLDGKSFGDKIDALRDGTAGNTVYVGPNGERLEKGLDGKYYPEGTLKDLVYKDGKDGKQAGYYPATNGVVADDAQPTDLTSKVVASDKMSIAQVNPDGTVKNPVGVSNVASGIGLNGYNGTAGPDGKIVPAKYDATKAADVTKAQEAAKKLYELDGNKLNNAVTAGDLQALAVAGLDFTGNNNDVNVHRELGTKLTVEGERNDNKKTYTEAESAKNNIIVEADKDNSKLVVKMASDLADINTLTTREKVVDGKNVKTVIGSEGTEVTKVNPATPNAPVEKAKYGLTTEMTKTEADGKVKATTVSPEGLTVKADNRPDATDKSEATYDEDGLKVKDNKGNEAISLTSTTTADDKTTNTLALKGKDGKDAVSITSGENGEAPAITFAKSGTGADEKGTGTITGLKDVEKNPDGTAKDRTQAANAGYVDDRLAEMNAGKPFEYFDTNGNQVVRGKDGKFYTPKELEGKIYDEATKKYYSTNPDGTKDMTNPLETGKGASEVSIKAMPNDAGPVGMSGVASGIGLNGYNGAPGADGKVVPAKYDATKAADVTKAQDAAKELYKLDGDKLNNVVTAGDLQALAVAGLDFVGNETTKDPVHRSLGTKLVVEGESTKADKTLADFGATAKDNIYVDTDKDNNKLVVKMTEDLKNINSLTTKGVDNGDGTSTVTKLTGKGTEVSKEIPGTVGADGTVTPAKKVASTNYGADGLSTKEFDQATGAVKGETTVSPTGVNLYGKDGKDGKDAKPVASLVNNIVNGKNNPTLEFAKDGTGADAKGTGTITGLKAPEVDKKTGKALDPTAVASAGYVDNKIDNLMTQVGAEYKKDENGNVIFDADGKPVIKQPKFKPLNGIKTNEDGSTEVVGDVTEPEKEEKTVATAVEEIITKMNEGVRYVADQNENAVKNSDGTSTSEAVLNDDKIGVKDENYKKQYLGSSLAILSGEGVEIVKKANGTRAVADGTVYKGDNLITEYTYESGNGTVRIAMKENPEFKTLAVNDEIVIGNNDGANPVTINKDTGITVTGDNGSTNITGNTLSFEGVDAVDANGNPITDANGNTVKTPTGRITGLAAPELNSDGTLKDPTQAISAGYMNEKMGAMDAKLNTTKKDLSGGIAGAVAMANLPQVRDIAPHKHNIAAAYGYYGKEQALALGVSGISDNERAIYKASASVNTRGDVAFGLGLGYQFDAREELYGENIIDRLNKLNAENIGIRRENEDIKRENSNIRRENAEFKSIIQQLLMDVNELKKSK